MPASVAPNVGLNYGWSDGEGGWGAGNNYNLYIADWMMQPRALDILNTPPGSPTQGDGYICGTSPTGAWSGKANQIAIWYSASWYFFVPKEGWRVWVADEDRFYFYDSSVWRVSIIREHVLTKTAITISSNTITADTRIGGAFTVSLTANVTTWSITNVPANDTTRLVFRLAQDATGGRTVAWPASFKWVGAAPTVSSAANAIDLLELVTFDGGTTWLARLSPGFA